MGILLRFSFEIQEALDRGELFELELEECLEDILKREEKGSFKARFRNMKAMADDLKKLEVLLEDWGKELENLQAQLYDRDEENYAMIRKSFGEILHKSGREQDWDIWGEQILVFFVYTYFCGAVYDDMIYTKAVLSVFSLLWIREILLERWYIRGEDPKLETVCRAAWEYAREIEHSDENLNLLEEIFDGSALYKPENFLPGLTI